MPDPRVVNFEGKTQVFPADATDAEISSALNAIPSANSAAVPSAKTWSISTPAIDMAATKAAVPLVQTAVDQLATNPGIVAAGKIAGRVGGLVKSIATKNPFTMLGSMEVGSKAGGDAAAVAQAAALKASPAIAKAAPYAQVLGTLSGAQGGLDLAQMAEPNRQDIGVLGMGTQGSASDQAAVMKSQIANLVKSGTPVGEATRTVYNMWAKFLHAQQAK